MKKIKIVALLLSVALLPLTFIGCGKDDNPPAAEQGVDYSLYKITDYLPDFGPSFYTGMTIGAKETVLDEITDDYTEKYVNRSLLSSAVPTDDGKANKSSPIDYADYVYLYILYAEEDGTKVGGKYFTNAYSGLNYVQVGAGTFGEEFDNALIGLIPDETGGSASFRTFGTVSEGDVIALTYSVTVDGEDSPYESISSDRFDLAEEDQALSAAILQNIRAIGEEFSFDLTLDIDKDGEDELCHYKAAVEAVVTENPIQIVATLPSDHFSVSSTQDEEMLALNGKTLTFSLIIDHSVAYQADTLETLRLKSLSDAKAALSYQNDEATDTAAYLDAFMAYAKETLISQRESQIKSNKETLVWQTLADKITDGKMPADAVKESYDELREQMRGEYMYYLKQSPSFVLSYPSVDYYVRSNYYPYDTSEYADYEDYLFSYVAPRQVFQKLLMYAIAENENLTLTKEEEDEAYNSYLDEQIAYYNASSQTVSREELVSYYGEDYIRKNTSLQRLSQKVSAFLLENNTLDETVSFYAD